MARRTGATHQRPVLVLIKQGRGSPQFPGSHRFAKGGERMGHAGEETIRGVSDDSTAGVVFVLDRTLKRSYGVQFTGGRLTYADRGWGTKNGDGLDAVIKALGALAEKGATSCSVDPV